MKHDSLASPGGKFCLTDDFIFIVLCTFTLLDVSKHLIKLTICENYVIEKSCEKLSSEALLVVDHHIWLLDPAKVVVAIANCPISC